MDDNGSIKFQEVRRQKVKDMLEYVAEMERGSPLYNSTSNNVKPDQEKQSALIESLLKEVHARERDIPVELVRTLEEKLSSLMVRTPVQNVMPLVFLRSKTEHDPSHRGNR